MHDKKGEMRKRRRRRGASSEARSSKTFAVNEFNEGPATHTHRHRHRQGEKRMHSCSALERGFHLYIYIYVYARMYSDRRVYSTVQGDCGSQRYKTGILTSAPNTRTEAHVQDRWSTIDLWAQRISSHTHTHTSSTSPPTVCPPSICYGRQRLLWPFSLACMRPWARHTGRIPWRRGTVP